MSRALMILMLSGVLILMSCQSGEEKRPEPQSRERVVEQPVATDTVSEAMDNLPPADLLQRNCEIASHVAVVDAQSITVADEIHTDDGAIGYVVEEVSAELIEVCKGNFADRPVIRYFSFLEYPTGADSTRLGSLLVYLNYDAEDDRLMLIEAGQFRYTETLGRIAGDICRPRSE